MSELGEKLIASVRRMADGDPDHVDAVGCKYVHNSQGACIVGRALMELGLINETLEHDDDNRMAFLQLAGHMRLKDGVTLLDSIDDSEMAWVNMVQDRQDELDRWIDAVKNADDALAQQGC